MRRERLYLKARRTQTKNHSNSEYLQLRRWIHQFITYLSFKSSGTQVLRKYLVTGVLFSHDPWGTPRSRSKFTIQRPNDGKLEVCVGDRRDMIMNLGTGKHVQRLCQASSVEMTLTGKHDIAVQVDGEPWKQTAKPRMLKSR